MHIIFDTPGGVGLYFSYNIFAWLITSILIALGLWQITLNQKIYYSRLLRWLTVGCICLVIPVFYQFEFTDHAIPRILALIGGLLFLFSLYQFQLSKKDALHLLTVILIAVILEACFGLIQFFLFEEGDWAGYKVGKSRPHGVFLQPNVMASFMATGFAISLFLSINRTLFKNTILLKFLIGLGLTTTSFLLVLLQSRTGFVAAILVILLSAPYLYYKNKKQFSFNIIIIVISALCALFCLENSKTPIRGEQTYESVGARHAQFVVSIDMIKTKPIIGYGYGGFERSFIDHFNEYAIDNPDIGNTLTRLSHPHNELLFWVVEGGIVSLMAFILFTIGYLSTWFKIPLKKALILLALILPILLHTQLEFPFYSSVSHWLVFLILLWITDLYASFRSGIPDKSDMLSLNIEKTFLIRFFALLIPTIFIPFLLTTLQTANILVEQEKNFTNPKSLERFNDIINPIAWQSRLDAAVYSHIFIAGLRDKDTEKLEIYSDWALTRIKHKPRVGLYSGALIALKAQGKNQEYQLLLNEAKRTYPQKKDWEVSDIETIKGSGQTKG